MVKETIELLVEKLGAILIVIGLFLTWSGVWITFSDMEHIPWYFYGAALVTLMGTILYFRKNVNPKVLRLQATHLELEEKSKKIKQQEQRLQDDLRELNNRILQFNQELKTYHEWMEFPTGIAVPDADEEVSKLRECDQAFLELLQQQTEYFFSNIKHRKYYQESHFKEDLLWKDVFCLCESVAKIYNPNVENPLLQTNIEDLLRAVNQISINLIVLLDRLPINVKNKTLEGTYGFIQKGVKGFDLYEKAAPYLDYIQPIYHFGRIALGGNPITIGMAALASELGKKGTKHFASHVSEKYALRLLNETICILANEMVGIYGKDYRYREANWIYGAELTDLIFKFPLSQEILQAAFNEIGNLRLRSEYDRLFLYRCLASHQTADPEEYLPGYSFLKDGERQKIIKGLEQFYDHFIYGGTEKKIQSWKNAVEGRLGYKMHVDQSGPDLPNQLVPAVNVLSSLASFLLEIKDREIADVPVFLSKTGTFASLDLILQKQALVSVQEKPPMIFSYPELEPSSSLLSTYLGDLILLNTTVFPFDWRGDQVLKEILQYFRQEKKDFQKDIEQKWLDSFANQLLPDSPESKLKFSIARQIMVYLESEDTLCFLYKNITIKPPLDQDRSLLNKRDLWLLGTQQRLILLAIPHKEQDETLFLWEAGYHGEGSVKVQCLKNKLIDDCQLERGTWSSEWVASSAEHAIVIAGVMVGRYGKYFSPLMRFVQSG
ncbi:MAG: hypothetical protein HQM14_13615 [SAR324 cluster bacterium]|nr:hypothetical protein [SAR324 cluster bacterium]